MKKLIKYMVIFLIFGVSYYFIEVAFSGGSNWSSYIMGGVAGILISIINTFYEYETPKWKQISLTTFVVVFVELVSGLILKIFGLKFWNYSDRFLNVEGLICLRYSLYWLLISPLAIQLDDWVEYIYFGKHKPDNIGSYVIKLFMLK